MVSRIQVSMMMDNILDFLTQSYKRLTLRLLKKHEGYFKDKVVKGSLKDMVSQDFQSYIIFDYDFGGGTNGIDIFYRKFYDFMNKEERKILDHLQMSRLSFFRVLGRRGKKYKVKDLMFDREIDIVTGDMTSRLKAGKIVKARILPLTMFKWSFFGAITVLDEPKIIEEEVSKINLAREIGKKMENHFIEIFGSDIIGAETSMKAQEKIKKFFESYSQKRIKELESEGTEITDYKPPPLSFPKKFSDMKDVGICFSEGAFYTFSNFKELRNIFDSNFKKNQDTEELFMEFVSDQDYLPNFVVKKFINKDRKKTVKVFSKFYDSVKNFEDVMWILRRYRRYIDLKEPPMVELTEDPKE